MFGNNENPFSRLIDTTTSRAEARVEIAGLATGLKYVDRMSSGLMPGDLWVVAGRPMHGKTSFLANIAVNVALGQSRLTWFLSADQSEVDLAQIMVCSQVPLNTSDIRIGAISDNSWPKLVDMVCKLRESPLLIERHAWIDVSALRRRLIEAEASPKVILIDKFNSLVWRERAEDGANNRTHELNRCIVELKNMAQEFGFTAVVTCDVNKSVMSSDNSDGAFALHDLKDFSGVLESYADKVIGIVRPELNDEWNPDVRGYAEVSFLKHRGPIGTVRLRFQSHIARWENQMEDNYPLPPPSTRPSVLQGQEVTDPT